MIFFDIDETLMDNNSAQTSAAIKFYKKFEELKLLYSETDFSNIWSQATEAGIQLFLQNKISLQEQRRVRLREIFQKVISDSEADELFKIYFNFYKEGWTLFKDVIPCLDYFSNEKLGIISNGDSDQQRQKLKDLKIFDRFNSITISSDIGIHKPDKELFFYACKQAEEKPEECFYISDNFEADMIGAKNARITGIWLNRNNSKAKNKNAIQIQNLYELKNRINPN
jgi:putative hydrolase of the HAD superfamily